MPLDLAVLPSRSRHLFADDPSGPYLRMSPLCSTSSSANLSDGLALDAGTCFPSLAQRTPRTPLLREPSESSTCPPVLSRNLWSSTLATPFSHDCSRAHLVVVLLPLDVCVYHARDIPITCSPFAMPQTYVALLLRSPLGSQPRRHCPSSRSDSAFVVLCFQHGLLTIQAAPCLVLPDP